MRWTRWVPGLLIALAACANVSRYESGAMIAHGERLDGAAEVVYYSLQIRFGEGLANEPAVGRVQVRLAASAPLMPLASLTPATVARYLPRFVPPPQWPETWKKRAQAQEAYSGGGFHFRFDGDRLVSVGMCSHCSGGPASPVLGTADGLRVYALPLTRMQLRDVFGEPTRLHNVNEVRY